MSSQRRSRSASDRARDLDARVGEACFQCDLDIPHVCYAGMPNARWGWTDEAAAALEGAQRHGFMGGASLLRRIDPEPGVVREQRRAQRRAPTKPQPTKKRRTR